MLIKLFICLHHTYINNHGQLDALCLVQRLPNFQVVDLDDIFLKITRTYHTGNNCNGEVRISNVGLVSQMLL